MKLIVLGLDGASYSLINRFSREGWLPNFKKIMNEGKYGPLISTTPPHTAPGWVSSLTGVPPGEHGIYQFWDTQSYEYVGKFMGSRDVKYPFIWDILNAKGYSTGIINVPMSHPPKKINGYMLTWPLSNTLRYCYPDGLIKEIADNRGQYISDLMTMFKGDEKYILEAIDITKRRLQTMLYLAENRKTDFLMSVFTEIDRVSHFYWHYMDDESAHEDMRNAIRKIYIETDCVVGELLNQFKGDVDILIYSDHGFEKGILDFYVQTFLVNNNFMNLKRAPLDYIPKGSWFEVERADGLNIVDWENTIAYMAAPGSYGINVNLKGRQSHGIVPESDYNNVCDRLIHILREIVNPVDNTCLFEKICKREDVYSGSRLNFAPDIVLIPKQYGIMVHHKLMENEIYNMHPEQKGMHSAEGIVMLYGEKAKEMQMLPNSIEEVAGTILKFYDIEAPEYMKCGSCLHNINSSSHYLKENYSKSEEDSIKERLSNLGYY